MRVWDLPTRLFHWSLVLLVAASFYTGLDGGLDAMDYHMASGYALATLLLFRIGWGFVGGKYSRFFDFVKGPRSIYGYLRGDDHHGSITYPGHNPLAALSVLAMLGVLLTQVVTGLFANDDVLLEGPLAHLVTYDTSREITGIHNLNKWLIAALIALHLSAIAYHRFCRGENLVAAMVTGSKPLTDTNDAVTPPVRPAHETAKAFTLVMICAAAVYAVITYV